jgi:hypothetical protein
MMAHVVVPKEHLIIARSFNCGSGDQTEKSRRDDRIFSAVPMGLAANNPVPALKRRAIVKSPVRDIKSQKF